MSLLLLERVLIFHNPGISQFLGTISDGEMLLSATIHNNSEQFVTLSGGSLQYKMDIDVRVRLFSILVLFLKT